MRCTAKNEDGSPCQNEAETRALSGGFPCYVCEFHNDMASKAIQANRVTGLGAFEDFDVLAGRRFKERRQR